MKIDKQLRLNLGIFAVAVLFLAFTALVLFAFFPYVLPLDDPQLHFLNLLVVVLAFLAFLGATIFMGWEMFIQFTQHFYDLSWEEAGALVARLVGMQSGPQFEPILRVQDGRANPDGLPVLFKVGGPGYLSIAHNSAAVTSRLGKLDRVLGPGFHHLKPFERCWDVVDLRPQHRTLHVEFTTSDGIPAYCDAEIRFRIASDASSATASDSGNETPNQPYPFSKDAVLKLTTNKFVTKPEGTNRIADWCIGLVNGALDGEIRDLLEQYSLNDFLNPGYSDEIGNRATQQIASSPEKPVSLKELETIIEEKVKQTGRDRGIDVGWVRLEPVRPAEETIFNQWMEFWQARSAREISESMLSGEAKRAERLEKARTDVQVEFLTSMLHKVQELGEEEVTVPSELIMMSFVDVVRMLSERDPAVQHIMFSQAESLVRIVNAVRKEKTPFGPATRPLQALLANSESRSSNSSPQESAPTSAIALPPSNLQPPPPSISPDEKMS